MKRLFSFTSSMCLAAVLAVPAIAEEQEIYVSTGAHGEVAFSDEAGPGAERVVVDTTAPVDDPLAELDRRIEQTLTVANALEQSRLAREQARAEAAARMAEARASAVPEVVYQDRYVSSPYLYPRPDYHRRHPHRHHRPPHKPPHDRPGDPEAPIERPISKAFPTRD